MLGSAAGGGFPQWNCGCSNCRGVREGTGRSAARTQESVAVSADGDRWFLLNCSPEIRSQIESFVGLHPKASRHSPVDAIVVTNGDLDHTLGLLSLRESHPLVIYATERVRAGFTEGNVLYRTLERFPGQVTWRVLEPGREAPLAGADGRPSGLVIEAVSVPGKQPIHLEHHGAGDPRDNVGLKIREAATGRRLAYFPAAGDLTADVRRALGEADCVFFDGTFWSSDELPAQGLGTSRAEDMAHVPVGGPEGSLARLGSMPSTRRIFIHINNTNPVLREDSPERQAVVQHGWEVAFDGMEIVL